MRKLCLQLILVGIIAQPLVEFLLGHRIDIPLVRYWSIMQLVLIFAMVLWLLTWPLEQHSISPEHPSLIPTGLILGFYITLPIIFIQTIRGIQLGYYSVLGDAETLFWITVTVYVGWSAPFDKNEWQVSWNRFLQASTGLVILGTINSLGIGLGIPLPGYIYYDLLFLMVLTFFVYFVRVFLQGSSKNNDSIGLIVSLAGLILSINKAILFSIILAIPFLLHFRKYLANIRIHTQQNKKSSRKPILLLLGYWAVVLLFIVVSISPSLRNYYLFYWQERVLHGSSLLDLNIGQLSGGRTDLWELALYWLGKDPWLGQGIGFRLKEGTDDLSSITSGFNVHNQYVYFLTALGVPSGTAIIAMVVSYIVWVLHKLHQIPSFVQEAGWTLPLLGYVIAMFAFGLGSLWNITPAAYTLFGLSIGILARKCSSMTVDRSVSIGTPHYSRLTSLKYVQAVVRRSS